MVEEVPLRALWRLLPGEVVLLRGLKNAEIEKPDRLLPLLLFVPVAAAPAEFVEEAEAMVLIELLLPELGRCPAGWWVSEAKMLSEKEKDARWPAPFSGSLGVVALLEGAGELALSPAENWMLPEFCLISCDPDVDRRILIASAMHARW